MRGKDFNIGLRGGLIETRHYERMGAAIWLYGWLVLRQTHQSDFVGWVLGGSPITYAEIEEETGFNPRTLERWMQTLRRWGYIETESRPAGMIVRILRAKKFPQGARKVADTARKGAGGRTRGRGATWSQYADFRSLGPGIDSSSVDEFPSKKDTQLFHRDLHSPLETPRNAQNGPVENSNPQLANSSCGKRLGDSQKAPNDNSSRTYPSDLRLLRQLLRKEREEAVRRELAVGSGPEVRRS